MILSGPVFSATLAMGATNNLDSMGRTNLIRAVQSSNIHQVKELLHQGAYVNTEDNSGNSAYCYAFYNGDIDIAVLLEKVGADPNKDCFINNLMFKSHSIYNKIK